MDNMNEPENQGHPDPGFRSLENKVSTLERQIAEQQDRLRDYEKSLVERIADVDDDRRTTASRLQRAWRYPYARTWRADNNMRIEAGQPDPAAALALPAGRRPV